MRLIELHIIQSFPVSCLNRDDVGAPKTAVFGGVNRARISSQCLKRAVREMAKGINGASFRGSRTRKAADDLAKALTGSHKWESADARKTAEDVLHLFLSKNLPKAKKGKDVDTSEEPAGEEQTSTLLYFSPDEIKRMADGIDKARGVKRDTDAKALKDAAVKALGKGVPKDAADIAIFGRMVSNAHDVTLEGAAMFSHALSTHKCENDIDFWTAVDDEKASAEDAGAGNMGTAEFTSATYYRYAALNLDLLANEDHLKSMTPEERKAVVDTFIRATLMAVPGARRNSMNAATLPVYVLGIFKEKGQPLQLVNAFETPMPGKGGLTSASIKAMLDHHASMKKTWGIEPKAEVAIPDADLNAFCAGLMKYVI
jgi:CRISPR system Cascade subunit CasC